MYNDGRFMIYISNAYEFAYNSNILLNKDILQFYIIHKNRFIGDLEDSKFIINTILNDVLFTTTPRT